MGKDHMKHAFLLESYEKTELSNFWPFFAEVAGVPAAEAGYEALSARAAGAT
jgi:hypothetical protein